MGEIVFDEVISRVANTVDQLMTQKTDAETKKGLDYLNEVYQNHRSSQEELKNICKTMIECKLLDALVGIWDALPWSRLNNDFHSFPGQILLSLKEVIWNYSDKSYDLSKKVYQHGQIIPRLMEELDRPELKNDELNDAYRRHHVKASLGILHNFVRHYSDNRQCIKNAPNGIQTLLCYSKSDYLILKAYAFIVVAFCVNELETPEFLPGTEVFQFILTLLESAFKSPNHVGEKYGLSAAEIVEALCKLASSDANKSKIIEVGFLPLIVKMLDAGSFADEENIQAANFIWYLTLNEDTKLHIQRDGRVKKCLRILIDDPKVTSKVKNQCADILYVLCPQVEQPVVKKHVMLSYQWASQDIMLKLREYLEKKGFIVWMDLYDMKGSLNASMAAAVENAWVVIVAMTEKYAESRSTQKELEYADFKQVPMLPILLQKGYKPDGWLGLLVGSRLYVDLCDGLTHDKCEDLVKQMLSISQDHPHV